MASEGQYSRDPAVIATIKQFLRSNLRIKDDTLPERRAMLINGFSIIAIALLIAFAFFHFQLGNTINVITDLAIAVVLGINLYRLRTTHSVDQAASVAVAAAVTIFVFLFANGGVAGTAIFWTFLITPLVFYLKGRDQGLFTMALFLVVIYVFNLLRNIGYFELPYDFVSVQMYLASQIVLTILVFFWAIITERDEEIKNHHGLELRTLNRQLSQSVAKLKDKERKQEQLIEAFDNSIIEVQKKNKTLEDQARQIQKEKARDEALLGSLGEGMVATDTSEKITILNRRAEELLGFSAKEAIGKPFYKIIDVLDDQGEKLPLKSRPFHVAFSRGKPTTRTDIQYRRKNGDLFPVAVTSAPIRINGKSEGIITVFRDITEEKAIDRAKTEFVSLASHQLRTPLSATNWYVEMLLAGDAGKLTKEQKDYLSEIHRGNERLVDLVNSLLNVSRLELGTFMVEPTEVDLAEVAKSVIKEVRPLASKKKVKFKTKFSKTLQKVKADENLIRIIFQNLITNATKYNKDNGEVLVSIARQAPNFVIKVKDTGIGIPKNQLEKIFEKLFRADNVLKTDTNGTGLGLYIIKQILDETGGEISVRSKLNQGTEFTVLIPLSGMNKKKGSRRLS